MLGVPWNDSPAHAAGLRSGDVVTSIAGAPVETWTDFAKAYVAAGREGSVAITVQSVGSEEERELTVPALGSPETLGTVAVNVLISGVSPDSAAEAAGLEVGDLIVAVDGAPVGSFDSFAEIVRTSDGRALELQYARDGDLHRVQVAPQLMDYDSGFGIKEPRYLVGITAEVASLTGVLEEDRELNPVVSLPRSVAMTVEVTRTFLAGFGKLVTGEVPRNQVAGPIGIAEIAGHAYERGWETYLSILVLISINLGILNLLPIPVLDGGQAVIFAIEGIRRAPLSIRTREIVQQVGFTFLMMLMGFAFWNDLSRQWTRLLDWLAGA
jgi:regulator of sigma E protease